MNVQAIRLDPRGPHLARNSKYRHTAMPEFWPKPAIASRETVTI
jgi:hypothetical protein